jgi:transcriptional regulator with XRE-family HTH domain
MTYSEMLHSIILESKLSLRQIASKCEALGISITPSYISQLKNNKLPPPNPEVSIAIAKACSSKLHAALVFLGYMEKAPEIIKDYMNTSTKLYKLMLENLCDGQTQVPLTKEARDFISRLDVISAFELTKNYLNEGQFGLTKELAEEMILVSGGAINTANDGITTFVNDTSMSPTIPIHSMLTIMPTKISLIKEKDIIALYPYGRKMVTLRRIFFIKNLILLIPEDTTHDIISTDSLEKVDYVGKVISYKVDL